MDQQTGLPNLKMEHRSQMTNACTSKTIVTDRVKMIGQTIYPKNVFESFSPFLQ